MNLLDLSTYSLVRAVKLDSKNVLLFTKDRAWVVAIADLLPDLGTTGNRLFVQNDGSTPLFLRSVGGGGVDLNVNLVGNALNSQVLSYGAFTGLNPGNPNLLVVAAYLAATDVVNGVTRAVTGIADANGNWALRVKTVV